MMGWFRYRIDAYSTGTIAQQLELPLELVEQAVDRLVAAEVFTTYSHQPGKRMVAFTTDYWRLHRSRP